MKVDCNDCGASLPVGETARFVTCAKCASRLEIKRSGSAVYTEVLRDAGAGDVEKKPASARGDAAPAKSAKQGGESVLHILVGGALIGSDAYWWMTDPSLQTRYVRFMLLAAGIWLIASGIWKGIANARARLAGRD